MKLITLVRQAMEEKKGEDVVVLDVRKLSTVTDYHVICTGNNPRHLQALIDTADEALATDKVRPFRRSGTPESGWMILDCLVLVLHVFSDEARKHYALETLWKDAPLLDT